MKVLRRLALGVLAVAAVLAGLLFRPDPLFAHARSHGAFEVRSDRPIDPAIEAVLDDAQRRLATSAWPVEGQRFRIYICNEPWRMWLLTRSPGVGGLADTLYSRNIYIREADVRGNRIVIPASWGPLADAEDRPLSYFIAHEAGHVVQARRLGRLAHWRLPRWLAEGYADFVAKGVDFDVEENRRLLLAGDPLLTPESGLYRRYHLMVAALLARPGMSVDRLFANPPSEEEALRAARGG
jgi:hypothetical protein